MGWSKKRSIADRLTEPTRSSAMLDKNQVAISPTYDVVCMLVCMFHDERWMLARRENKTSVSGTIWEMSPLEFILFASGTMGNDLTLTAAVL